MFDEQRGDEQEPNQEKPTDWSGAIIGILLLPVFFFFMHEGKEDVGLNVCVCLLGILLAVKVCWELRSRIWFWGIIFLALAADVPLIFMIHWPEGWVPGLALLPVALAEFLITVWTVRFVQRFMVKNSSSDEEE